MLTIPSTAGLFAVPRLILTLKGNPRSEEVIARMRQIQKERAQESVHEHTYVVCADADEITALFQSGISPNAAVVLFDGSAGKGRFRMKTRLRPDDKLPAWANGVLWGVCFNEGSRPFPDNAVTSAAYQLRATFQKKFADRLSIGEYPWGRCRKKEPAPRQAELPAHTGTVMNALNSGPNLAAAIANTAHALELPEGSRISWARVVPTPISLDVPKLTQVIAAMRAFEGACAKFARVDESIHREVLAGVTLAEDPRLRSLYLNPSVDRFSVDRPDLHYTGRGTGLFASEIDEMPGGLPELVHIDASYKINGDRWTRFFDWLHMKGPVLFIVSDDWSKVYLEETRWLVDYLRKLGYDTHMRNTSQLADVQIGESEILLDGARIGTIWRQFPIFETTGRLVDLVAAANQGVVRMVPEFGHFGNKTWFSLYRKHHGRFETWLDEPTIALLDEILPDSHLIQGDASWPALVAGVRIESLDHLRLLPENERNKLVLKVVGANNKAARSYGVLMGHGLSAAVWATWINEMVSGHVPFIVQRRLETCVAQVPVLHTTRRGNAPELFNCRVLLRPWIAGEEIVSVSGCAVPTNTLRVHGRVDMAILPINLGQD